MIVCMLLASNVLVYVARVQFVISALCMCACQVTSGLAFSHILLEISSIPNSRLSIDLPKHKTLAHGCLCQSSVGTGLVSFDCRICFYVRAVAFCVERLRKVSTR